MNHGSLGIAGAGTVAARWISTTRVSAPPPPAANPGATTAGNSVEFWRLLSSNGQFDLLKLQLFVFTLLIGAYVVWRRIIDTAAFRRST